MSKLYTRAPDGQVYVCGACGKTSPTQSGYDSNGERVAPSGWDESCMFHGVLCYDRKPWTAVPEDGRSYVQS